MIITIIGSVTVAALAVWAYVKVHSLKNKLKSLLTSIQLDYEACKKSLNDCRTSSIILPGSSVGNSTRQVDNYVQALFKHKGAWIPFQDHSGYKTASFRLIKVLEKRLLEEHNIVLEYQQGAEYHFVMRIP